MKDLSYIPILPKHLGDLKSHSRNTLCDIQRSVEYLISAGKFKYRNPITVCGSTAGEQTDYQVLIELDSTNFDFNLTQTNGEDIRFTDSGGDLLDYWIESWDKLNETAKIWVKVPSIPASPDKTEIFMYYGNPSVSSASDGGATFDAYDDFESGFSGWGNHTADYAQSSEQAYEGTYSVKKTGVDGHDNAIVTKNISSSNCEVRCKGYTGNSIQNRGGICLNDASDSLKGIRIDIDAQNGYAMLASHDNDAHVDILVQETGLTVPPDGWFSFRLRYDGTTFYGQIWNPDGSAYSSELSYTTSQTNGYAGLYGYDSGWYYDLFFVRKYISPEPTVSIGTIEEP